MNSSRLQRSEGMLALADGSTWVIAAGDEQAAPIVSCLEKAMQLRAVPVDPGDPNDSGRDNGRTVRRFTALLPAHDTPGTATLNHAQVTSPDDGTLLCVLPAAKEDEALFVHLVELSLVLARDAETRGGLLLHGALAERDGMGIILAAPGGTGKSTASERLPSPWRSLCDDATLVVHDADGSYWAHPWPTWSRFLFGGPGGSWDVPRAVPLKEIFFLAQSETDQVEAIGNGQAATLLLQSAQQVGHLATRGVPKEQVRKLHVERFDNACALARAVPAHLLHLSLTGTFWLEIERVLFERGNHVD